MGDFITVVFTIPAIGLLIDGLIIGCHLKNRTGIKIAQFAVLSSKGFGYAFLINVHLQ